jgi:hypothetical protein
MTGMNGTRLSHIIVENELFMIRLSAQPFTHRNPRQNTSIPPQLFHAALFTKEALNRVPFMTGMDQGFW